MFNRTLARFGDLATISLEPNTGTDGEGAPTYGSSSTISARVVEENKFIDRGDGSGVDISLSVWIPADETPVPSERDRLTFDSRTFIVEDKKTPRRIRRTPDHFKLMCRDENAVAL